MVSGTSIRALSVGGNLPQTVVSFRSKQAGCCDCCESTSARAGVTKCGPRGPVVGLVRDPDPASGPPGPVVGLRRDPDPARGVIALGSCQARMAARLYPPQAFALPY